jgi:hypothetical protein
MSNPINPRLQHLIQPTAAPAPAAKPLNPAAAWPFPTGNKP